MLTLANEHGYALTWCLSDLWMFSYGSLSALKSIAVTAGQRRYSCNWNAQECSPEILRKIIQLSHGTRRQIQSERQYGRVESSRLPCYVVFLCMLTQQIKIQIQISWVGWSTEWKVSGAGRQRLKKDKNSTTGFGRRHNRSNLSLWARSKTLKTIPGNKFIVFFVRFYYGTVCKLQCEHIIKTPSY